ncbi:EamA family transporter [Silvibacterium dinghuense]|uniref:EamA family transporter n=1 Tax=Silvibacterium dinghuense TaxID=1560006 RepID=A0A4Q1S9I7_9BACT|nr:EamA family transporter [Silvibacterium dinghuense]RXS93710.1 EamA family transporter [Silvibacterium dinghuense]GGH07053.1 drug/metabolite exporter YedA [Silvibacterium dinghuense]
MRVRRLLAYAAIYFLWGGSFLGIREVVAVVPPFFAAAFRFFTAGVLLLGFALVTSRKDRAAGPFALSGREWRSVALLGLVLFVGDYACLFWAEQRIASGIASVIAATIPVWIFAGEVWLLRTQRLAAWPLAGIVLGFAGVVTLTWESTRGRALGSLVGMLVAVAGCLCWSLGTLLSRKLQLPASRVVSAGWQMAMGGAMLFALSAATGEWGHLPHAVGMRVVVAMAYLIGAASIVAFTAYVWLLGHEPMGRVASYAYVNPVVALALGATLAGERLAAVQIAGSALVVLGVFATLRGRRG